MRTLRNGESCKPKEKVEGFLEKGRPFRSKPSTLFREQGNGHLLNKENDKRFTNAVRHGMHGIHFSAAKRLVRKHFVN